MLSDDQIDRYSRQIILDEVGGTGQVQLLRSRVAVWGEPQPARELIFALARAGIGEFLTSPQISEGVTRGGPEMRLILSENPGQERSDERLFAAPDGIGLEGLETPGPTHTLFVRPELAAVGLLQPPLSSCYPCTLTKIVEWASESPLLPEMILLQWAVGVASLRIVLALLGRAPRAGSFQIYSGSGVPWNALLEANANCSWCVCTSAPSSAGGAPGQTLRS